MDPSGTEVVTLGVNVSVVTPWTGDSEELGLAFQFGKEGFDIGAYRSASNTWRGLMVQAGPSIGIQPGGISEMNGTSHSITGALGIGVTGNLKPGPLDMSTDGSFGGSLLNVRSRFDSTRAVGKEGIAIGGAVGHVTTQARSLGSLVNSSAQAKGYDSAKVNKDGSITASRTQTGSHIPTTVTCDKNGSCH